MAGYPLMSPGEAWQLMQEKKRLDEEKKQASWQNQIGAPLAMAGGIYAGSKIPGLFEKGAGLLGIGTPVAEATTAGTTGAGSLAAPEIVSAGWTGAGTPPVTGGIGAAATQYLPGIAGAYGTYDLLNRDVSHGRGALQGGLSGAGIGWTLGGPLGAGIGGGVGLLAGLAKSFTQSGKGEKQRGRDEMRDKLLERGLLSRRPDDKYHYLNLPDGTQFNVGQDIGEERTDPQGNRRYAWQMDSDVSTPGSASNNALGYTNPLAAILAGGDDDLQASTAGYLGRGLLAGKGDDKSDARFLFDKLGMNQKQAFDALTALEQQGRINRQEHEAYNHGVNQIFGKEYFG